jgi:hypothetical protein
VILATGQRRQRLIRILATGKKFTDVYLPLLYNKLKITKLQLVNLIKIKSKYPYELFQDKLEIFYEIKN